jgi:RNA polymerase sigma-70 factor (ECF subfamily)
MIIDFFKKQPKPAQDASFEQLFAPHISSLFGIACGWTSDHHAAEDLLQELAIKVSQRMDDMRTIEKLRPWLVTVMYRMFIDTHRRHKNSPLILLDSDQHQLLENSEDHATQFNDESEVDQLKAQLKAALSQLDPESRATITLYELEGFSLKEIADIQHISIGTVKSRLHRAKEKLKSSLEWEPFAGESRFNK